MTCMILLSTIPLRSHFATNTVGLLPDNFGDARTMEAGHDDMIYELNEHNMKYMTHIQGDMEEDDIRLRQIEHLEDDLQSIDDIEYHEKREQEEREDPEGTFWRRSKLEGHQQAMDEAYRGEQARDRQERRRERSQIRFKGTKEELQKMRVFERRTTCDHRYSKRRKT
eukprot:4619352-Amphidinium_carterae.1